MSLPRHADRLITVSEAQALLAVDERTMQGLLSAQMLVRFGYRHPDHGCVELVTERSARRLWAAATKARKAYEP